MLTAEERIQARYRKEHKVMTDLPVTIFERYMAKELDSLNRKITDYCQEHDD